MSRLQTWHVLKPARGADLSQTQCVFDGCQGPATKQLSVVLHGIARTPDLCAEHFHDVDWGVISDEEFVAQLEGEFGSSGVA